MKYNDLQKLTTKIKVGGRIAAGQSKTAVAVLVCPNR